MQNTVYLLPCFLLQCTSWLKPSSQLFQADRVVSVFKLSSHRVLLQTVSHRVFFHAFDVECRQAHCAAEVVRARGDCEVEVEVEVEVEGPRGVT